MMNFSKPNRVLISQFDFQINDKIVWSKSREFLLGLGILQFENNNPLLNATLFFAIRATRPKIIQKLCLKRATQFTMIREFELLNFSLPWCSQSRVQNIFLNLLNFQTPSKQFFYHMEKSFLELGDLLFQKYQNSKIVIKDHFQLTRGKTPPTKNPEYYENGTIKWINSGVLTNLYFLTDKTPPSKLITEKAVKKCNLTYAKPNSVLLANIDLSKKKIVWVRNNSNFCLGTDIWTFNQNVINLVSNNYFGAVLFFSLRQINFELYKTGLILKRLQASTLLNMKINWVSDPAKQKIFFTLLNNNL